MKGEAISVFVPNVTALNALKYIKSLIDIHIVCGKTPLWRLII